jgi:hypothetical protein
VLVNVSRVVHDVCLLPIDPQCVGLLVPNIVLLWERRRYKARPRRRALVIVEDAIAVPPVFVAVVPEGHGSRAVPDTEAAAPHGVNQPGTHVHV